jgi:HAD superfamily hydrolase (TIGR01509 family)
MSKYKCIIFDCDGVLVDSEPLSNQVMVDMANEYGASLDLQYAYNHFKGYYIENCIEKIETLIKKKLPKNFEKEYRRRSFEKFKNEIQPVEGIVELIKNITIPFCVASSGPEHKIKLNLELTGLLPYFENKIFSCYTIGKWKPEPDVFLWAAETMGFQPNECVVIEDSITGVKAALAGGFDVFGYTAHDYSKELESKATMTFKRINDLKNYLL